MRKAIIISLLLMAATTLHAATETVDGITWTYTVVNGVASVGGGSSYSTAVSKSASGSIVIPSTLGGYTVTSIGNSAFYDCSGLTNVTIPDSVTKIESLAFSGCSGLTSVTIPNSVTNIGSCAFQVCSRLTSVTIPNSVMSIGAGAFSGCSGLMSILVGSGNTKYKSVNGLLLTKDGKTLIGGVNGNVTIPDTVTSIGYDAFRGCSGLMSVTIPDSVTSIGRQAFSGCSGLTSVTIPNSVTSVGEYAFSHCSGLLAFAVGSGNSTYKSVEGLLLSKNDKTLVCGVNGEVTIPNSVTSIGGYAFSGCSGLTRVTIPDSVTNIGSFAFFYCSSLTNVTIPDSVTSIGGWAFSGCSGLSNIIFRGDTPAIVDGSVYDGINHMTTYVSRYANGWDAAIAAGTWMGRPITYVDVEDDLFPCDYVENLDGTIRLEKYTGRDVEEIIIPQMIDGKTVASISSLVFASCAGLRSITIPSTVTWIEDEAFAFCTSLASVTYLGDAPDVGINIYKGTPRSLVVHVPEGSIGWSDDFSDSLPNSWNGRRIAYASDSGSGGSGSSGGDSSGEGTIASAQVVLTVTNVVVHYVLNSVVPEIAVPVSGDTGFVTVVTEITGGAVAVAESWATNYPGFTAKFGNDFSLALTKPSGKRDSQGNALMVWQDYVAGTDPTDENDIFKASITLVDGVPQVSYTPELPETEAAKRKYTTYGKARLQDEEWHVVDGDAANYNFFKVTVEMR